VKIFLVEDSALLRERLAAMLTAIPGVQAVGHAASAKEAISGILATQPDAVVLDIHLAEGNGFDVLRGLRAAACAPAVYMLTSHPLDGYRQIAERLGARGFFDKANDVERLRDTLAAGLK
jgi:two-component system, NarL family, response regulator DevR